MLETVARDVRFAIRALRRDPASSVFAVLIAGLGIGACTVVFSLVQALLLRPLPFEHPDRLAWVANGTSENLSAQTIQVANLQELRDGASSFEGLGAFFAFYGPGDVRLTDRGEAERLTGVPVTQNLFPLLGVKPLYGRSFDDAESQDGAPAAVMLDHAFWERRFAADPRIVGQSITLDGAPARVIGILPASFDFEATFTPGKRVDFFRPFPLSERTNRQGNTLAVVGRLRPGATLSAAQAEAKAIGDRIAAASALSDSRRNSVDPRLSPLRDHVSGRFTPTLLALAGAVAFLMLLVCANLANLLLVRATLRQREMAVRAALGAARRRLMMQLLVESLVLSLSGAVLGLVLAWGGTTLVSRIQGTVIPLLSDVRVDGFVLTFTIAVSVLTGLAFGLLPALQQSGAAPAAVLSDGSRGTSRRAGWMRQAIVVAEVAMVCVLLTVSGLLTRSLGRVLAVDPGFATTDVIAMRVDAPRAGTTGDERRAYLDEIVRATSSVAGVRSVGLTDALPLGDNFGWRRWSLDVPGRDTPDDERLDPLVRMVDPGYFTTMGVRLRAGRLFGNADAAGSEPVIILNETLAKRLWPGGDALGQVVKTSGVERRVVGIVRGARYFALDRDADIEMYMPMAQTYDYAVIDLVVRGALPPATLAAGVREALHRVAPGLPVKEFRTMEQLVDRSTFARRFLVLLVAGFALFGVALAGLGLYAVISCSVDQRTQEIGIRMALGATAERVRRGVLAQTGVLIALGVVAGAPLAVGGASAIRGLLFGVDTNDGVTIVMVLAALSLVAGFAGWLPARRATRIDPGVALRRH